MRSDPGNASLKFLYRSALLGGAPEKLAEDVDSNITFSPDGRKIAFVRYDNPDRGKYRLIERSIDDSKETVLTDGPTSRRIFAPTWSPDGKKILYMALEANGVLSALTEVDVSNGKQRVLRDSAGDAVSQPEWMPDGKGLLAMEANASDNYSQNSVVYVSYPEGYVSPLTRDTNTYNGLSVSRSGQLLVTVESEERWNLSVIGAGGAGADAQPVSTAGAFTNFTWTHDGRLISDKENMLRWVNPDTGAKGTFATEPGSQGGDPWACDDGRYVVFLLWKSAGKGTQNVWRADTAGGNLKQLSFGKQNDFPVCSPDSQWVYYTAGDPLAIMRVPIDGGPEQKITDLPVTQGFDISSDGKTLAFATEDHTGGHEEKLALVSAENGNVVKQENLEKSRFGLVHFSRDGKGLIYPIREKGVGNLWLQPLDGSPGKPITSFKSEYIWDYHWSPDGSRLAIVRGHNDTDVVLIRSDEQKY